MVSGGVLKGLFGLVALSALALGCGGAASMPRGHAVHLRLQGGPARATVTIDDRIVGSLDVVVARGVALAPGKHRISVEAEGFLPFDRIVEAKGGPVLLNVNLEPVPD